MKRIIILLLIIIGQSLSAQEFRGTWIARDALATKEGLARAMDSLAANNFNVVFVNVWSRGYPLWQSDVFQQHTGMRIDPIFGERDILAEAIAEGHKHGLHIEAWFEYGFVGGWSGNQPVGKKGPIFDAHPDWVAKKANGNEIDNSNFYWMIHTHPGVQEFLIGMAEEICLKYDIDGIELDRIRYSSLEYGYDSYTDSLYRAENNNTPPPTNVADPSWIRWRADKINDFISLAYSRIKQANPKVNVSNAPSLYSSSSYTAYQSFCQDWVWWVNNNKVDNVQVQSYVSSSSSFSNIMDFVKSLLTDHTKAYPSLAIKPNNVTVTNAELSSMVNATRNKGFLGNAIWYYTDLGPVFPFLKGNLYQQKVHPPHSTADWRELRDIISITDTVKAKRSGAWVSSNIIGYNSGSVYAAAGAPASISYYFDVPESGYYEVYLYNVTSSNRTDSARVLIHTPNGDSTHIVNQANSNYRRWAKLQDCYLEKGLRRVFSITNEALFSGKFVSADAGMIILNRRLSPQVTSVSAPQDEAKKKSSSIKDVSVYPMPFNSSTTIQYTVQGNAPVQLALFNVLGETIYRKQITPGAGVQKETVHSDLLASGIYIFQIQQNSDMQSVKLIVSK